MPATINPIPNIAAIIDTSGSMSKNIVEACIAEVGGILKSHGVKEGVRVLAVDAKVHNIQRVFKKEQVTVKGGGGTVFRTMRLGLIQATPFVVANQMRPSVACTADAEARGPLSCAANPSGIPKLSNSTLPEPSC